MPSELIDHEAIPSAPCPARFSWCCWLHISPGILMAYPMAEHHLISDMLTGGKSQRKLRAAGLSWCGFLARLAFLCGHDDYLTWDVGLHMTDVTFSEGELWLQYFGGSSELWRALELAISPRFEVATILSQSNGFRVSVRAWETTQQRNPPQFRRSVMVENVLQWSQRINVLSTISPDGPYVRGASK